jgi:DNA-directed RNA polymerase subunit RPC12/RpoP
VTRERIELQRCWTCGSTALSTFEFDSKGIPRMSSPFGELDAHEDYFLTALGDGLVITCQECDQEQPFPTWATKGAHADARCESCGHPRAVHAAVTVPRRPADGSCRMIHVTCECKGFGEAAMQQHRISTERH